MSEQEDSVEKSFEPTPRKLEEARRKGDVFRSVDLQTAAGYVGFLVVSITVGSGVLTDLGANLQYFLSSADALSDTTFASGFSGTVLSSLTLGILALTLPFFLLPSALVCIVIAFKRAFVFAPTKLEPKLSRLSIVKNFLNKFGRSGLFEFAKSFVKLLIYSIVLGRFLFNSLDVIIGSARASERVSINLLLELSVSFISLVVVVALCLGVIDAVWQYQEYMRKNMMSRKEIMDETKESDGNPYVKQARQQKAHALVATQMMAAVPKADVVVVNPTHYSVALSWDRTPGSAPVCSAKGVDFMALRIREIAQEHGVPIHHDAPTARALHRSLEIGDEIAPEYYQAVALAVQFADSMRAKARKRMF